MYVLWQMQLGAVPIPFSVNRSPFEATLEAVAALRLTDAKMVAIAQSDRGRRLIKGQVFLWPEARDWRDLWDEGPDDRH